MDEIDTLQLYSDFEEQSIVLEVHKHKAFCEQINFFLKGEMYRVKYLKRMAPPFPLGCKRKRNRKRGAKPQWVLWTYEAAKNQALLGFVEGAGVQGPERQDFTLIHSLRHWLFPPARRPLGYNTSLWHPVGPSPLEERKILKLSPKSHQYSENSLATETALSNRPRTVSLRALQLCDLWERQPTTHSSAILEDNLEHNKQKYCLWSLLFLSIIY